MKKEKTDNNEWIVCLGGEDWWYHSHGHFDIQLMKHFSARKKVLYVCSVGMRMPSPLRDKMFWKRIINKLKSVFHVLKRPKDNLYVYSPLPVPFYGSRVGRAVNRIILLIQLNTIYCMLNIKKPLVWVNTPTAWTVIEKKPKSGLIYQRTDDYAAFNLDNFNSGYIKGIDLQLIKLADLVIHVSEELHTEASALTDRSLLFTQGVDKRFFEKPGRVPEEISHIRRPIVGYVGGMDKYKFDTQLVYEVAEKLPEISFVLVGESCPNTEKLLVLPNVHFLGKRNHADIPAFIHSFDICMVPTAVTEWGLKCRPLKLMEYLAAKKPVIATSTPASKSFKDFVFIASNSDSWVETINEIKKNGLNKSQNKENVSLESWDDLSNKIWNELILRKIINDIW